MDGLSQAAGFHRSVVQYNSAEGRCDKILSQLRLSLRRAVRPARTWLG